MEVTKKIHTKEKHQKSKEDMVSSFFMSLLYIAISWLMRRWFTPKQTEKVNGTLHRKVIFICRKLVQIVLPSFLLHILPMLPSFLLQWAPLLPYGPGVNHVHDIRLYTLYWSEAILPELYPVQMKKGWENKKSLGSSIIFTLCAGLTALTQFSQTAAPSTSEKQY